MFLTERDRTKYNNLQGIDFVTHLNKRFMEQKASFLPEVEFRYKALKHQKKALLSKRKNIFLAGGVGAGKTDLGSIWTRRKANATPENVVGVIAANSYSQLIDSTLRNMYKNFKEWGLDVYPEELPKVHKPFNIKLWNGKDGHWVEVLCRSLDSYQLLSGTEVGWIWVDECFMTKKDAIDVLIARLRDKRMKREIFSVNGKKVVIPGNQILYTTTLDEPDSWMYEMFVSKFNPDEMEVIYSTTYDNEKNLPKGYIDSLKAIYTEQMFKRMVLSKWVSSSSFNIYHAFDRSIHESTRAEFDPTLPVIWAHDFNIGDGKPMSSALGQVKKGRFVTGVNKITGEAIYKIRPEVHWFDEIIVDSADTNDIITEFKNREWFKYIERNNLQVIIHGDASGRHKDTRSKTTDYQILKDAGFDNQQQPDSNPRIRDRHNAVNAMLKNAEGDVRTKIHPRCKTLLNGMETVHLKKGSLYLEEETRSQHVTTAVGYYYAALFPIVKPEITSQEV